MQRDLTRHSLAPSCRVSMAEVVKGKEIARTQCGLCAQRLLTCWQAEIILLYCFTLLSKCIDVFSWSLSLPTGHFLWYLLRRGRRNAVASGRLAHGSTQMLLILHTHSKPALTTAIQCCPIKTAYPSAHLFTCICLLTTQQGDTE